MVEYTGPSISGGAAGGQVVPQGTPVWRPGLPATDKKQWPTALYALDDANVKAEANRWFKTPADQRAIKAQLVQAGYLPKSNYQTRIWSADDTAAWKKLLEESNASAVSWNERLASMLDGGTGGAGGAGGPSTATYRTVNFSDPKTAKAAVQSSFRSLLGRDPSDAEYAQFTKALKKAEAASPTVSRVTTSSGGTSTTTTGGLTAAGAEMMFEERMKATPELETELVNKRINEYGDVIARLAGI